MTEQARGAHADALVPVLIVMALKIEAQGVFERAQVPVLYTGLGKVNAAHALTRRLAAYQARARPLPQVVNFGTAGSRRFATGTLVACDRFLQRDMDCSALGIPAGVTPFEDLPAQLRCAPLFEGLPSASCGSADAFETGAPRVACDVVDMEAYALAKVCQLEGAAFGCAKYITDGADADAAGDWHSNLPKAAEAFWQLYQRLANR